MFNIHRVELDWGGRPLVLETGKMARQADGAVLATYGESTVLATVVLAVAVTDLAAPRLMAIMLRAGPAPLTPRPVPPELSATRSAEWPR